MRLYWRARREDEKTDRIEAILASAKNLLTSHTLDECNLSIIASDVGITKAALYRYFRVKELIFLEIYRREIAVLATALQGAFANPQVATLVDVLVEQPIFCKLTAELGDVLEKPLTEEEAANFKLYVLHSCEPLCQQLRQQFGMTNAQVIALLLHIKSSIVGCWKLSHPSPMMDAALHQHEALTPFRLDFAAFLQQHLTMLLGQMLPSN